MSLKILLVEATKELRAMIAEVLERRGHHVIMAESLEEGKTLLDACDGRKFDWVISNHRFPKGTVNGADFLRGVQYAYPDTQRLLISGGGNPNSGSVFFFLQKPFKNSTLLELLESQAVPR